MVTIIDYGMGNLGSIKNMLVYLGYEPMISDDLAQIAIADKLILPGVGNFGQAMQIIKKSGLLEILNQRVLEQKTPLLGICLGMQLLTSWSEEGQCEGFGWIKGQTRRFTQKQNENLKIPHMGWDYITQKNENPLFEGLAEDARFYFVHSYYVSCDDREDCLATTDYGITFDSIIQKGNIIGVQFHPEKSHKYGMNILKNFMEKY